MYHSLTGIFRGLVTSSTTVQALLDLQGLEWQVDISRHSLGLLPRPGENLKLFTYLHYSEDQQYLCGFTTQEERQVFLQLLKVQGIGPRAALKILSGTTPQRLVSLLESGDLAGLEQIPGLGKKTSQKVLLTLQGKLVLGHSNQPATNEGPDSDIIQALIDMGFDRKQAAKVVGDIAPELAALSPASREQELLRRAIVALS